MASLIVINTQRTKIIIALGELIVCHLMFCNLHRETNCVKLLATTDSVDDIMPTCLAMHCYWRPNSGKNDKNIRGRWTQLVDHPRSVVYNFGHVHLSVCQTIITFESLDVVSSYFHTRCISREYGSSLYMKVIGSRSRSQEQMSKIPLLAI